MGKHEPMSAKAIANRIKAKGLQKIKYYCEMCKKQCRDDNGFKCHIMSESHQRQALIVSENPEKFVNEFSKQFMDGFMYLLRTRYRTKRVLANTVFQDYIKEKDHVHMNGTRWTSLTEFANWMGEHGHVKVDDSERGVMITYIDRDPETLRRQELEAKRAEQAKQAALKSQQEIERQMEATKRLYEKIEQEKEKPVAAPVPIVRVAINKSDTICEDIDEPKPCSSNGPGEDPTIGATDEPSSSRSDKSEEVIERPLFQVQTISLKNNAPSSYRPPPPKRKVLGKGLSVKKKVKSE